MCSKQLKTLLHTHLKQTDLENRHYFPIKSLKEDLNNTVSWMN